jgi:hypothetical protein
MGEGQAELIIPLAHAGARRAHREKLDGSTKNSQRLNEQARLCFPVDFRYALGLNINCSFDIEHN